MWLVSIRLPWFLQSNEGSLEFGDTDNAAASLQLQRGAEENGMPSSPETASNDMDQGSPAAMLARELGAIVSRTQALQAWLNAFLFSSTVSAEAFYLYFSIKFVLVRSRTCPSSGGANL